MKKITFNLCIVVFFIVFGYSNAQSYNTGVVSLNAAVGSSIQLDVNTDTSIVTMTLKGPFDRWFGVGFGASSMITGKDCVYVSNTIFTNATINYHAAPSTDASLVWTEISNTVSAGIRTVIATRAILGTGNDFSFPTSDQSIMFIYANGNGTEAGIMNHGASRGATTYTPTLGIDEVVSNSDTNKDLIIYPNPTDSYINLDLPTNFVNGTVNIYNVIGQRISESKLIDFSNIVDLSKIEKGIYLLEVVSKKGLTITKRVVKQ